MPYNMSDKERLLPRAVAQLKARPDVPAHCLEYVREAVGLIGLTLPSADDIIARYGHSTAIGCFHILDADPGKYGWVKVTCPLSHPVMLAFYGGCGTETAGDGSTIVCGHVALLDQSAQGGVLRSSKDYKDGPYWLQRLVGLYVPR